jgi:hypothetical protein
MSVLYGTPKSDHKRRKIFICPYLSETESLMKAARERSDARIRRRRAIFNQVRSSYSPGPIFCRIEKESRMTPHSVSSAAERKEKPTTPQTELHGAATPAPLPSEPEAPPQAIPLPDPNPKPPNAQPEIPSIPQPTFQRWQAMSFIAGETPDEFNEFYERLDDHYMPYNEEERLRVAKLAEARWVLHRRKKVVEAIEARLYADNPVAADWTEADFKRLALADAYRVRAERTVQQAQANVDAFVVFRGEDSKWQAYFDLADRRFQLEKENYKATGIKKAAA